MNIEENRFSTFSSWPSNAAVEASRIAKAGFFYTGEELEVECFACGGKIKEWNYGDQVMAKHRRLNSECPFVVNPSSSGNIPKLNQSAEMIGENYQSESERLESYFNWPSDEIVSRLSLAKAGFYYLQTADRVRCAFCHGICGYWEVGDDPKTEHKRHFPKCSFVLSNFNSVPNISSQISKPPKQSGYAALESRLASFVGWDADLIQTPEMLARAGFYFTGTGDQVRCFQCDGGLRYWDPDDDPWIEHARWFPYCVYVKGKKGKEFMRRYTTTNDLESPNLNRRLPKINLETLVEQDLNSNEAHLALSIGLPREKVRAAILKRLDNLKGSYDNADELINDTLNLQIQENPSANGNLKSRQPRRNSVATNSPNLEEENRRLKEARLCKICMDNEIGIVFVPCGHLTSCVSCAPSLQNCPVCRSIINGSVRTFMS